MSAFYILKVSLSLLDSFLMLILAGFYLKSLVDFSNKYLVNASLDRMLDAIGRESLVNLCYGVNLSLSKLLSETSCLSRLIRALTISLGLCCGFSTD